MTKMRKEYDPNKAKRRKRKPIVYDIAAGICGASVVAVNAAQVCNSKKVSDHHAVIPTPEAYSRLPVQKDFF